MEIVYEGSHIHPKPQLIRRMHGALRESATVAIVENAEVGAQDLQATPIVQDILPDALSPSMSGDGRKDAKDIAPNSKSLINEGEFNLKKRKLDKNGRETAIIPRMSREPRVVVETTSSANILEDGYRWRKYGQKNVKGNLNPRSYYKCTNVGCPVHK
eukprot:Gb_41027 [translate_table: standard]